MNSHVDNYRSKQAARRLPDDVLEGYERRAGATAIPLAKLPEIVQLRAMALELLGHIAWQNEQLQEVAGR